MLFEKELQEIVKLISNTMDTFTTALFLVKGEKLIALAQHSLSRYIRFPTSIPLEDGGILTLALDKETFHQDGLDQMGFEFPYYKEPEEIKTFMAVRLLGGKGLLVVDSKRPYTLTEKHLKLLSQFAHLAEMILERARDLRGKLLYSSKYLMVGEMLKHLHPPAASWEELQEGFSQVMEDMGVEEAMVVMNNQGANQVILGYGPLSIQQLNSTLATRGTPWQNITDHTPYYVHKGSEPIPFIMGIKEARFPSMIMVSMKEIGGILGLASSHPKDLSMEVLDLVNILADLLEPSLKNLISPPPKPASFATFLQELETSAQAELSRGKSMLLVVCKVKNIHDLDKKMGIFKVENLLKDMEKEMGHQLEGRVCIFRGHTLIGYKTHSNHKMLEASGKALQKNLPLSFNGTKAKLDMAWDIINPNTEKGVEETIQHLLKRLNSSKRFF